MTRGKIDKKGGFTLMELLIVVAILGILSAVGLSSFIFSQQKGRDVRRKSDLTQIAKALESYNNDFGRYPLSGGMGTGNEGLIMGCGTDGDEACVWDGRTSFTAIKGGEEQVYLSVLPADLATNMEYYYLSDGQEFALYSVLENANDRAYHDSFNDCSGICSCGSAECNYKLTDSGVIYP